MTDDDQHTSKIIASLLGPVLLAVTISETVNLDIWEVSLAPVVYLNGLIFFAIGLAIVRFHNLWRWSWTLAVTIAGWALVAAGLFRMFFPTAPQADPSPATYAFIGVLATLGLFLTFKGYR